MKLLSGVKKRRQISSLERFEKQLQSGLKTITIGDGADKVVGSALLSDKDIKRIKQEITTLKSRI